MKAIIFAIVCTGLAANYSLAQKTDVRLEKKLRPILGSFHGTAGLYVENLKTGKIVAVNAHSVFPTASIIKVPILTALYHQIDAGRLRYDKPLLYRDSLIYGGSGLMQFFKDSSKTDLGTAAALMVGYSDNTASLWLQSLVGGSDTVNYLMEHIGLHDTRDNSRTNRETFHGIYGWGQTTPREMATLLKLVFQKKILSPSACESMYRTMSHVYYDNFSLSQIPPYVQSASKQGMVDDSRSELVLVNAPHGDYVFYIATKNNKDQRWVADNEAWELQRKVSAVLWQYFEPKSAWKPAPGYEKYLEK